MSGTITAPVRLRISRAATTIHAARDRKVTANSPPIQGTLHIPSSGLMYFKNHLPNSEPTPNVPTLLISSQFGSLFVNIYAWIRIPEIIPVQKHQRMRDGIFPRIAFIISIFCVI